MTQNTIRQYLEHMDNYLLARDGSAELTHDEAKQALHDVYLIACGEKPKFYPERAIVHQPKDIVPDGCTASALAFDPGVLSINKDGSGYIAIDEIEFTCEDDRCEGPDGPEGSIHWIVRMDASEIIALRDFLNGVK